MHKYETHGQLLHYFSFRTTIYNDIIALAYYVLRVIKMKNSLRIYARWFSSPPRLI